jgi:carbon storage regulator
MLIVTRKQHEQIIIGENVRIKVMMIRGNQVRLALEAPRQVPIYRAELHRPRPSPRANAAAGESPR